MSPTTAFIVLLLSSTSALVAAQDTILSCAEVQCPTLPNQSTNDCNITSKSYSNIGISRIPGAPVSLTGLTWVEAVTLDDTKPPRRFVKDFYLASDPRADINTTGACALFFTNVSNTVDFSDDPRGILNSQGTCAQAMSEQCVGKMLQRARGVDLQGLSSKDACAQVQSLFEGKMDPECSTFSVGTTWSGVEAKVLSGPGAPAAITAEQNSSSNCWPIEPKSYELTPVTTISTTGDNGVVSGQLKLFNIVPILTVFFPGGSSSDITQTQAQLTCMKAIDSSVASKPKVGGNTGNGSGNTAPKALSTGGAATAVLAAVLVMFTQPG